MNEKETLSKNTASQDHAKLDVVRSHVERISRFNTNLRPFDYKRLRDYASLLVQALDAPATDQTTAPIHSR